MKPKPRKTRPDAIPDELIAKALIACSGRIYHAGELVGLHGSSVHERIKLSPYLQQIREEALQKRLDAYEKALDKLAYGQEEHNLGAICFGLKTLGKHRGYVETQQHHFSGEHLQSVDAMLKQLAQHQEALKIEDKTNNNS